MEPKRTFILNVAMLITAILCSSCVTQALMEGNGKDSYNDASFTERLWEATDPENDIIEIPFSEIPEAARWIWTWAISCCRPATAG